MEEAFAAPEEPAVEEQSDGLGEPCSVPCTHAMALATVKTCLQAGP